MKLEDQVCSLELSKKLKELGVKQESAFYWVACEDIEGGIDYELHQPEMGERSELDYAAFTVAELGELLPLFETGRGGRRVLVRKYRGQSWCYLSQIADTEADARAKMLIYLIEKGLIHKDSPLTAR